MTEHLTHGWEPELPADDTLLRSFVLATADHTAYVAERTGGRAARWADVAAADARSPVFFDNMAVLLSPPAYGDVTGTIARLAEFYPPERHVSLLSVWPTPDLSGAEWELVGHPPLMLRPPGGEAPPLPPGLRIEPVTDSGTLAAFFATLMAAFEMLPSDGVPLRDPRVLGGPLQFFLGLLDGEPVATAGARLGHGLVDVEWVSTVPSARGRGIGSALSWAATMADPALPAVLIASDDGRGVYGRMGYLTLLRTTMWHRPPAG
jgi:hypothetical protein